MTFPIFYETEVGETEPVEVFRISPLDARTVIDELSPAERRRKLAGTVLFHFGAFLKREWRDNDMLWGRLDGAERIISSVLPPGSEDAARLIRLAHLAILGEKLGRQVEAAEAEAVYENLENRLRSRSQNRRIHGLEAVGAFGGGVLQNVDFHRTSTIWQRNFVYTEIGRRSGNALMEHPSRVGKYELEQFLGGGMSHVYRAKDSVLGRRVALKILTEAGSADAETKARFLLEARMASNINHENIISVYDFGEEERAAVHGDGVSRRRESSRRHQARGSPAISMRRLKIALQVARALDYIHARKIIHRDIKPENIHIDAKPAKSS